MSGTKFYDFTYFRILNGTEYSTFLHQGTTVPFSSIKPNPLSNQHAKNLLCPDFFLEENVGKYWKTPHLQCEKRFLGLIPSATKVNAFYSEHRPILYTNLVTQNCPPGCPYVRWNTIHCLLGFPCSGQKVLNIAEYFHFNNENWTLTSTTTQVTETEVNWNDLFWSCSTPVSQMFVSLSVSKTGKTQCLKNSSVITPSNFKIFTSSFSGLRIWKLSFLCSVRMFRLLLRSWEGVLTFWQRAQLWSRPNTNRFGLFLHEDRTHSLECVLIHQLSLLFEIELNIIICNSDAWN